MATMAERLGMLVRALDIRAELDKLEREEAARRHVRDLRARFGSEYRGIYAHLGKRGTEEGERAYVDRRFGEMFPAARVGA